jgi:hypothetical protein
VINSFDNQHCRLGEQWDDQALEDLAKRRHQVMYALPDQGMQRHRTWLGTTRI